MRAATFRPSWFSLKGASTAFSLLTAVCFINGAFGNETPAHRTPNGEAITLQKMIAIIEAGTETATTSGTPAQTSVAVDPWLEEVLGQTNEITHEPVACLIPEDIFSEPHFSAPLVREIRDTETPTAADLEKVKILYSVA